MSVIRCVEISDGAPGMVYMEMRTLVEIAMGSKALGILIMHNHPSGNVKPSKADLEFTEECKRVLEMIDVKLIDHIIVGNGKYLSMKNEKMILE
ncbi:hypothetical protein IMSAG049_01691 [Clostridiales bacterium]|nr:hypothetical protein IMSAG049_01691 [Clostridiales bacterium]